jgi:hypothetical protein
LSQKRAAIMKQNFKDRVKLFVCILLGLILCIVLVANHIQTFLSTNHPIEAQILIIEGWLPDFALKKTADYFSANNYKLIITTGGPIPTGSFLTEYKTYANLAKSTLEMISSEKAIVAVPAPYVRQDRTYASALALKGWLEKSNIKYRKINVISLDAHARRSRFIFQKALGGSYSIGIIAIDDIRYDAKKWWASSNGFRIIVDEAIAYLYAIFFFPLNDGFSN